MRAFYRSVEGGGQGTRKNNTEKTGRIRRTKDETDTIVSPAFNAVTLEIFEPLINVPNAELRSRIYTLTLDL